MLIEGQQIGPYILSKRIGRGGFGEVWLGLRGTSLLTTKVALKLPLDDQIDLDAVKQEAVLWEQASGHANVLPIIEANIYDEQVVIVSEYVPNGSLADVLKRNEVLPIDKAVEITLGILSGLEYLHSRNIIHRDLKPANILMQGETPRLADFGISRAMRSTQTSASVNIKGTPPYMAPEAFDGKRNKLTDIWSVGVILHHLLAGKLPFPQQDITSMIGAIIGRPPEPLPTSVPAPIRKVVETALAKDSSKRFLTAAAMRTALRDAFGQSTSDSRPIVEEGPEILTAVRPKKRSAPKANILPVLFAFVVFILLLAGVLGIASLVMRNSALTNNSRNIDLANQNRQVPKTPSQGSNSTSNASNAIANAVNANANSMANAANADFGNETVNTSNSNVMDVPNIETAGQTCFVINPSGGLVNLRRDCDRKDCSRDPSTLYTEIENDSAVIVLKTGNAYSKGYVWIPILRNSEVVWISAARLNQSCVPY
jgi:eukaryotic-like serine/threonine-protein kinase